MKSLVRKIILESLLSEDEKHIRQLFTNWANKKSKNPELAMSLMDDFFKYQKNIKRDFASFSSAEEMKQVIDKARGMEQEKQKASDAVKVFENGSILVIVAKTHEASCRYAAGTKWCTGAADTDDYWKRHNRTGTEFIWIIKSLKHGNPDYKFSLHFKWKKTNRISQSSSQEFDSDWCNAENRCSSKIPKTLLEIFSDDEFDKIFNMCMTYHKKRYQELGVKSKNSGQLLTKFIERVRQIISVEADWQFNDMVGNSLDAYYVDREYEEEFIDFIESKREEILGNVKNVIEDDVVTMMEEDLTNDYEDFLLENPNLTEEDFIIHQVEDYIMFQFSEVLMEEIGVFADEFLREKGI
jgi:hypothetical protein